MALVKFLAAFLLITAAGTLGAQESALRMAMPDYPPYTYEENGKPAGFGYDLFVKVMAKADLTFTVRPVSNYGRALVEATNNTVDGFFLASKNDERDQIAEFSKPLTYSVWTWVSLKSSSLPATTDPEFKKVAKVGAQLNSNIHKWLTDRSFNVEGKPTDIELLLGMLKVGRVNVLLLPDATLVDILKKAGETTADYKLTVESKNPFGLYITKAYLAKKPDTLKRINAAIDAVIK